MLKSHIIHGTKTDTVGITLEKYHIYKIGKNNIHMNDTHNPKIQNTAGNEHQLATHTIPPT
jgi:hypothetical protein